MLVRATFAELRKEHVATKSERNVIYTLMQAEFKRSAMAAEHRKEKARRRVFEEIWGVDNRKSRLSLPRSLLENV
jgi:hypothetical protein